MWFAVPASVPRILALGAGCSVLVKTAQYVLRLDRVSSVDDVLVNAAGAVLAGLASRRWWRTAAQAPSDRPSPVPTPAGRLVCPVGPSGKVARRIVASGSGIPILMRTAADRIDDKASGFGLGADDYLTKPFELRELVLRLRALDRRRAHARPPSANSRACGSTPPAGRSSAADARSCSPANSSPSSELSSPAPPAVSSSRSGSTHAVDRPRSTGRRLPGGEPRSPLLWCADVIDQEVSSHLRLRGS